jgi:hypothetical protein
MRVLQGERQAELRERAVETAPPRKRTPAKPKAARKTV